mgnify:FL=1
MKYLTVMGFFDNLGNEFGKKTGKAIGNKLYGRHADDIRVGSNVNLNVNRGNSGFNGGNVQRDTTNYEAMEKAKRETLKQEQESKFLESIINVEFDANDKDTIVKTLTSLSSYVDLWIKDSSKNANVARSKFDTGLAMLSAVDASNPMITYFTNKKLEWSNYENKKRKTQLITAGIAIVVLLIIIIIGLAQS